MKLIKLTLTVILITFSVCHRCFGQIEYLFTDAVCEEEMKITSKLFGHGVSIDEIGRRGILRDAENAVKNETDPMRAAGSLARLYQFYEIFRISGGQDRCVQQILRLSEITGNLEIYVRATVMQAQNMIRIRDYSAAIECYKNGISHLEQIGATPQMAKLYCYLGYAYNLIRNDVLSTHSLNEAVDIVEAECNDPLLMGEVYLHAAIIYQSDSAYVKAGGYIAGAKSIFDCNIGSPNRMFSNLRNIATIVSADIKLATNHPDEAIGLYKDGVEKLLLTVDSAMRSDNMISFSSARTSFKYLSDGYNGLGKAYQKKGDLDNACNYFMKALEFRINLGAMDKIIDSYISIGRYYMHCNMLDSVYYYAKKGFEIADEIEDDQDRYHAAIILSEMFKKQEDYKNAYEYLAIAQEASLARSDMEKVKKKNREELEEALKNKNFEALEKTNKVQKVSNWMAAFVAMAVASLIVIGILFSKKKKKNRLLSVQRDILEQRSLLLQKQQEEISQKNQELRATTEMLEERNKELYRLSIVASITNNSIFIADIQGNIIWFNDSFAKQTGYSLDQIGVCTDLAAISASPETIMAYDGVLATKQAKVFVAQKSFKNGKVSWMQTSVTPVLDDNNNVTMLVSVCTDVTELRKAYDKIDAQNKEINDSIAYARKIQDAVQPLKIFSDEILGEHFLINMPRNVVSGDFHWVGYKNGLSVFTVADCTGHGVPGAFISILGQVMLNQTLNQIDNVNASQMLNLVRHGIIHQLHQRHKDGVLADSIDASMFVYDRDNCVIDYAGAYSNAYILRFGTPDEDTVAVCEQSGSRIVTDEQYPDVYLIHLKTNRMTLGIDKRDTIPFSNIKLKVARGDIAYATTDGFPDQFGGEKQKRFNISNFEKLLLSCCTLPMEEQRKKMERVYLEWKGDYEQTDDVHVLGIVL